MFDPRRGHPSVPELAQDTFELSFCQMFSNQVCRQVFLATYPASRKYNRLLRTKLFSMYTM